MGDNRTLSGENQVRSTCARPTLPHLPGKPDLANKARGWAIFRSRLLLALSHDNPALESKPRSNTDYWSDKLARNQARDAAHEQALLDLGFDVLTVWECETPDGARLEEVLTSFFGRP